MDSKNLGGLDGGQINIEGIFYDPVVGFVHLHICWFIVHLISWQFGENRWMGHVRTSMSHPYLNSYTGS